MPVTWELPEAIVLNPVEEADRIEALHSLNLLGSEAEDRFDRVTRLAAEFFKVPMAYVAFIDTERQWFKSRFGMCPTESSRDLSFCQYTIQRNAPLIIPDAREHPISRTHPMVMGEPFLRFYAGIPLSGPRGQKIGTFCILDTRPHEFPEAQVEQLTAFAAIVEREINLAGIIQTQHDLLSTREELVEVQNKLQRELNDAAKYVRLMLPAPLKGREAIDWQFHPSADLGGDGLGYRRLDEDKIAFYMLDVTGHGLGSALLAVTALELLRSRATTSQVDYSHPAEMLDRLNRTFQMKDHAGKFFSAWYGVYSCSKRQITYASGGHPPALLLTSREGRSLLTKTPAGGPVLGVFPEIKAPETTLEFPAGSELCLFTDGIYEIFDGDMDHGSYDEFLTYIEAEVSGGKSIYDSMLRWLERARDEQSIDDDISLLRFTAP
jgi:sigma-B regulation protein RsbU (phosphoserine phosphatase)